MLYKLWALYKVNNNIESECITGFLIVMGMYLKSFFDSYKGLSKKYEKKCCP